MFFVEPFILTSEFLQHVLLIVLMGLVASEYIITSFGIHKLSAKEVYIHTHRRIMYSFSLVIATFLFFILSEYFTPVKTLQYYLLVQLPTTAVITLFLFAPVMQTLSSYFKKIRNILALFFVGFVIFDVFYVLASFSEPALLRACIKTVLIAGVYGYVIQYLRVNNIFKDIPLNAKITPIRVPYTGISSFIILLATLCISFFATPSQAYAFSLTSRISDQSTELKAGDRLYFDVEIKWPENNQRQDLRIEYQILDGKEVIATEKVLRAVETQASFLDYIVVPTNTTEGIKELNIIIQTYDQSLNENISATFNVAPKDNKMFIYFFVLASAVGLIVLLVIFQIFMIMRTQRLLSMQH